MCEDENCIDCKHIGVWVDGDPLSEKGTYYYIHLNCLTDSHGCVCEDFESKKNN